MNRIESWTFYTVSTEYWTTILQFWLLFWRVWFEWSISFIHLVAVDLDTGPGQLIWTAEILDHTLISEFVTIEASVSLYLLCRQECCTPVLEWMSWISCGDWWSVVLAACGPSLSESSRCRVGQRTCPPPLTSRNRSRTARNCDSQQSSHAQYITGKI